MGIPPTSERPRDVEIERVRTLAKVLDRYGVDPLLGLLIPGLGDLLGSVIGLYILGIGLRRRLPKVVIARMLLNLGLDMAIGIVPVAGDLSDVVFKAHERNLQLIEARHEGGRARPTDWLVVFGALLVFLAAVAGVVWAVVAVVRALT